MRVHTHCKCILEDMRRNAPWPESEAASRVDHWGETANGIGMALAAVSTGMQTDSDERRELIRMLEAAGSTYGKSRELKAKR
jgi:hypothetical protein